MHGFVLAGGLNDQQTLSTTGIGRKALLPLCEKPLVEYSLTSLCMVTEIESIGLVIDEFQVPPNILSMADWIAPAGSDIFKSLASGFSMVKGNEPVFISACDTPLLSANMIEDFIKSAKERDLEIAYSFVSERDSERKFPGFPHTYVKLREGRFCGGGIFILSPPAYSRVQNLINQVIEARKTPWRIAGILGIGTLLKFIFGGLNIPNLERLGTEILGAKAGGIQSPYAEVAFNIDTYEQYRYARKVMEI